MPGRLARAKAFVLANGMGMVPAHLGQTAVNLGGVGRICKGPRPSNTWEECCMFAQVFRVSAVFQAQYEWLGSSSEPKGCGFCLNCNCLQKLFKYSHNTQLQIVTHVIKESYKVLYEYSAG